MSSPSTSTTAFDAEMMARALRLARQGIYRTRPNPAVGCVLVKDGEILGEGSTQPAGGNHAEIEALEAARAAGKDASGATAYVTLEPCNHTGRTGPCSKALIEAGIARAVIAVADPNAGVAGGGVLALAEAGIDVSVGLMEAEAETVNPGFYNRMRSGRPLVRLKLAASLDGRTAMASGESQWITGPEARADVQRLRGRSGAIVTGIETVLADDPALTVRDENLDIPGQPLRVVLDSRLRTPPDAKLLRQAGDILVVHAQTAGEIPGAECLPLPGENGIDLCALLEELGRREINEVLVECGPRLAGAFVAGGLVDELVVYTAATVLGSAARPLLELPIEHMADQRKLVIRDLRRVGDDVRWTLAPVTEER